MALTDILKTAGDNQDAIAEVLSVALGASASVSLGESTDARVDGEMLTNCHVLISGGVQVFAPDELLSLLPDATPEALAATARDVWPRILTALGLESENDIAIAVKNPGEVDSRAIDPLTLVSATVTVGETKVALHLAPTPSEAGDASDGARALKLEELEKAGATGVAGVGLDLLGDVEVDVTVELGRRHIPLNELLKLTRGSIIELEKLVGEPLEVYVNNRLIADGEAVVIDDHFGIRITNVIPSVHRAA